MIEKCSLQWLGKLKRERKNQKLTERHASVWMETHWLRQELLSEILSYVYHLRSDSCVCLFILVFIYSCIHLLAEGLPLRRTFYIDVFSSLLPQYF